ncbi:MAG: porin family protein [Bacteroidales bacterium]|nr:porin family protein [Bacteroidales bacterium]MDT8431324.1 porin family protein [Bacteroidales bacterium]
MRRITIILILLVSASVLSAQEKRPRNLPAFDYKKLHWGFTVGLNSMDYAIKRNPEAALYADVVGFQPAGFQVNIVSDLRLSDDWNLRFLPGINLGSRDMVYFEPGTWEVSTYTVAGNTYDKMTIGSSYLDFPLLLKYRSERVNNYRPYVIGGISYRLDMSAKSSYDPEGDDMILVKPGDFYLEVGFGIDQYLQYFKYSTEIKLAMGLRNIMVPGVSRDNDFEYVNSIDGIRSFLVMLNFHFE